MVRSSRSTIVTKVAVSFWLGLGACLWTGAFAFAEPKVTVIEKTYGVNANTAQGLVLQMSTRGPVGYWAFTRTNVAWRGYCEVSVRIRYTMPVHTNPDRMSPELRAHWDRMITAMRRHEEMHGQHAINAAREIEQAGCKNGMAILGKWRRADRDLDARTRHGRTQGVHLN